MFMTSDKERDFKETIHKDVIRNLYSTSQRLGNIFLTKSNWQGIYFQIV